MSYFSSPSANNISSPQTHRVFSPQPQHFAGYIPSDMTTSHGDYMHALVSSALLPGASAATYSQDHSPTAIATAQSALTHLVISMDWNQHQGSEYSPDGAMMNVSGHVGNSRASTYQRLAPDSKVKSGSVQKHRVETTTGSHSYILSPANTRRGGSSGASSQNDEDDNENHNMGGSSVEQQRRRRFLERNRMAASKCRQKKKVWIQDLERRAEDATAQNRALHIAVAQLKEEVLILKNQLLSHHNCGCSAVQQFMSPDSASSIDQTQAATAAAVAATAAGVFSLSSQQDIHSPRQQQHHMVHPSATAPSMLFQAPPPLLYHQPQPSPYHHHHHQSSSVDMSVVPNGVVGTSGAANSFVGNMDGVN